MLHYEFVSTWLTAKVHTERGASLVEYALLVALIAIVCIAAITALGGTTSTQFSEIDSGLLSN